MSESAVTLTTAKDMERIPLVQNERIPLSSRALLTTTNPGTEIEQVYYAFLGESTITAVYGVPAFFTGFLHKTFPTLGPALALTSLGQTAVVSTPSGIWEHDPLRNPPPTTDPQRWQLFDPVLLEQAQAGVVGLPGNDYGRLLTRCVGVTDDQIAYTSPVRSDNDGVRYTTRATVANP